MAVRYGVDLVRLKRLNNLMIDYSLSSRQFMYVPVHTAAELQGQYAKFEYCPISCRQFLVLGGVEGDDHTKIKLSPDCVKLAVEEPSQRYIFFLQRAQVAIVVSTIVVSSIGFASFIIWCI